MGNKFRLVRQFGKNISQTDNKAYRVETVELLTENEAFTLMSKLGPPYQNRKYEPSISKRNKAMTEVARIVNPVRNDQPPTVEINLDQFVSKFYRMNPAEEDIIPGRDLRNGMTVLIEDQMAREHVREGLLREDYTRSRALKANRWCLVTKLQRRGDILSFVGVYDEGEQISRQYNDAYHWIVKL